ncbi:N-acetylmuramoyl-L-alanine amidase family protein, partial [Virgibacillus halodenitrificans]|uniref:N-acetylmuramoyl-L-alanine amidase family protein n=1 Tax=Virgibacillus halodenitrificans TaxID=1482 RepID=UPI002DBF4750
ADEVTLAEINNAVNNYSPSVVKIFLDPGHGAQDPGGEGYGLKEKNVVLDIALKTADFLTKNYLGVAINLSRTSDRFLELEERAQLANTWGADYFVSFHNNAFNGSASGFESYIYSGNTSKETKEKQEKIHQYLASKINANDRGMKEANFSVLRNTNMPAILLEYLFIDNIVENSLLKNDRYREWLGEITAEALAQSFNLKKR